MKKVGTNEGWDKNRGLMDASLIVVAKRPEPGFTKTRLCPPFTPGEAAQFYRCLMLDTLALAARVTDVAHCVAYTPVEAHSYFQNLVPEGFSLIPQNGADLGERLSNALNDRFQHGNRKVVVMNSDGPTLPLPFLKEAFRQLQHYDITLGKGHDGGYYLIGMKQLHPALFENIAWSSEWVIPQTLAACRRLRLKVHQLPQWYDVDVGNDLKQLRSDLEKNPAAAPLTSAYLKRWRNGRSGRL
jgi:rSAM/selenodomain-associated transferase 1